MWNINVSIKSTLFDQAKTTAFSSNLTALGPSKILNLHPYNFLTKLKQPWKTLYMSNFSTTLTNFWSMFSVLGIGRNIGLKLVKPEIWSFLYQPVTKLEISIAYKVVKYLSKRSLSWKIWWATQFSFSAER